MNKSKRDGRVMPLLRAGVTQNERGPLERFMSAVGVGSIHGPYPPRRSSEWHACGKPAQAAMALLLPYLSGPKQEQLRQAKARIEEVSQRS
jgi:hypothetical protein